MLHKEEICLQKLRGIDAWLYQPGKDMMETTQRQFWVKPMLLCMLPLAGLLPVQLHSQTFFGSVLGSVTGVSGAVPVATSGSKQFGAITMRLNQQRLVQLSLRLAF